jgi:hypothetical protein
MDCLRSLGLNLHERRRQIQSDIHRLTHRTARHATGGQAEDQRNLARTFDVVPENLEITCILNLLDVGGTSGREWFD